MGHNLVRLLTVIVLISLCVFILFSYINHNLDLDLGFRASLNDKELEWLRGQESIIYAADKNAPPLRFLDEADGQYKGVLIDYVNSLSLEIGSNIELHPMLWEDALESLSKGETDICDMFASKERSKHFLFSKPLYNLRAVLAIRNGLDNIRSLNDLSGMTMAMQNGDYASEYLFIHYPDIKQVLVADLEEALQLVAEGKADATMGDEPVVLYQIDKNHLLGNINIIERPVYENPVVFAVSKSKPELVSILNKGIDQLNRKKVLEKAQQKWFGISTPIVKEWNTEKAKGLTVIVLIIVMALISIMIFWNNSLKKEINLRTKELEDSHKKLLQANKMVAIGELAAGIAHEIRNPLGLIRNHSFIIRSLDNSNENIDKSLDYIDSSVSRASKIIDNLLNFSRLSGNSEEVVDLYTFIENILGLQNKLIQEKNITYELECKKGFGVKINQESLKHIILNLISNAVDAIKSDGKITLKAYERENNLIFECIDTGCGIQDEELDRIFNPFFTTKEPGKGTGLGLYISYNEVKKLKGDISVESKVGIGSRFKITIPIKQGEDNNEGYI